MRPYIICHMVTSIDGKVTGKFLWKEECVTATEEYYRLNRQIPSQGFACGRVTMEESFTGGWYPDLEKLADKKMDREDYIADPDAGRYAVAFDRKGRLGWKSAKIEDEDPGYGGAHIVEVLCENLVTDAYLEYLQGIGVSYIFAGKEEMNLKTALEKLKKYFSIRTLLLEGGSELNGAFEREDLIDELSLVQAAIVADGEGKPLFAGSAIGGYELKEAQVLKENVLRLRYVKKRIVQKPKVAFICVHNSCRSQMAEALGKKYLSDLCECYSAGTETKPQINQDAVRIMKQVHGIDMEETQFSKLFADIPEADIVVSMGCNVVCPYIPGKMNLNWGLEDPSGQSDEKFLETIEKIERNILELRKTILEDRT